MSGVNCGITLTEKKFRITGVQDLLGSSPLSKQVYSEYIKTKAQKSQDPTRVAFNMQNAESDTEDIPDMEEKMTGFYRDGNSNVPVLKGYQVKGFLKAAANTLKGQLGLKQATSKIDKYVFIKEEKIYFYRDGEKIEDPEGTLERPLRAETMQGPRVALACSEVIKEGYQCEFTVVVLENEGTKQSKAIDMDMICTLLSYGQYNGLLQWRNAGYGSFTVEEIK